MKFMAKLWALLVLIGVCSFGLPAAAHTATDTLTCMKAGLEAKPFTGSYASRLKQARQLQAGTVQVRVNDSWKTLPVSGSLWQLCEGPSLQERLDSANLTIGELAQTNGTLTEKVGKLTTELETTGGELTKAKTANADLQHKLANRTFVSNIQWVVMVVLAFALILLAYDPQITAWQEARHQRSVHKRTKGHVDFTPEPQGVRNDAAPAKDSGDGTVEGTGPHAGQI